VWGVSVPGKPRRFPQKHPNQNNPKAPADNDAGDPDFWVKHPSRFGARAWNARESTSVTAPERLNERLNA